MTFMNRKCKGKQTEKRKDLHHRRLDREEASLSVIILFVPWTGVWTTWATHSAEHSFSKSAHKEESNLFL